MAKKRTQNAGFEDEKRPVFNQREDLIWVAADVWSGVAAWLVVWLFAYPAGRLTAAVLLLLDFLPFRGLPLKCWMKLNVNKTRTMSQEEERMSSVGGYSNPLCCLPYVDVVTATNVWKKNKLPNTAVFLAKKRRRNGRASVCMWKQTPHICMSSEQTNNYLITAIATTHWSHLN